MKPYCEAYGSKLPKGFIASLECHNLPSQLRMGFWTIEYQYTLDGMHEDNQDAKDHIQFAPITTAGSTYAGLKMNGVTLASLSSLLGIGGLLLTANDMYKSLVTIEETFKGEIAVTALAAATGGGWTTLDASDLTAMGRHLSSYFTTSLG